jgi:hypothetical protein
VPILGHLSKSVKKYLFCLSEVCSRCLDFYLKSSIHVAFAVVALAISNTLYLNKNSSIPYFVWLFCVTLLFYNTLKYLEIIRFSRLRSKRFQFMLIAVTLLATAGTFYFFKVLSNTQFALTGVALALGLSYAGLPYSVFYRENGAFKTLTVALVWSIMTVLILNRSWAEFDVFVWVQFVATIFWILALMLPFELKDSPQDRLPLKTIVQRIGPIKSYYLAQLFLVAWLLSMLFLPLQLGQYLSLILTYILAFLFLHHAMKKPQTFFVEFWVESLPILGLWLYALVYLFLK